MSVADGPISTGAGARRGIVRARPKLSRQIGFGLGIAALCTVLLYVIWLYETALRDPRYLDGWLLASAVALQIYFHARRQIFTASVASNQMWRAVHIFTGYVLVVLFLSHCDFGLPDSPFEWAMWTCVVLVTVSGIFGTYLSWAAQAKLRGQDELVPERMSRRRAELIVDAEKLIQDDAEAPELPLPVTPYRAWLEDFYHSTLSDFLKKPQNFMAHVIGSQRHMKRLMEEVDNLDRYLNTQGKEKLRALKHIVLEKDRLDFAHVQLRMSKLWLLVHLPLSYSLIAMTVLHIVIIYAFASGIW